jgi:hypothetical protein
VVDVDGKAPMAMMGGSLGGIMAMLTGALEPKVQTIIPISGGGGLSDMGLRTAQAGAVEGFILRSMGPLYTGTLDESGNLKIDTIVPNLNDTATMPLGTIAGVHQWDTMVADNLTNGQRSCGYVSNLNTVRTSLESDKGDLTRLRVFSGQQLTGDTKCTLKADADAHLVGKLDTFSVDTQFQWDKAHNPVIFKAGSPLVALADGMGLRRAHPDLRRFLSIAQLVLDSSDPAVFAKHLQNDPIVYGTGEKTGAHALVITTTGDNAVPANSGVAYDRAAGLVDYLQDDPRYGKPPNQVLLDRHFVEAQCNYNRFNALAAPDANICASGYVPGESNYPCNLPMGGSLCADMENFSQGTDMWGAAVPRLDKPFHLFKQDSLGGMSAALFPYTHPDGQHGFDLPGVMTDKVRESAQCTSTCVEGAAPTNPCGCGAKIFDIGNFMLNMMGQYLKSGEKTIGTDMCQAYDNCSFIEPVPAVRSASDIAQ